ncbi:MAG: hypothetical protein BGO09_12310 [Bacteroidetes bacterium 47-18]|nr:MAG: hypothetical protein BGO09_12310 [Bacteroidetes bacterium 47-18]
MKVSIIIPCYNTAHYVEQCVRSLVPSASMEWEFILVNDGSGDHTAAVLDKLEAAFGQQAVFRIIHQENRGLSASRNTGIALARGTYICFVDSDDWVEPGYIDTLLAAAEEGHELAMVSYTRRYEGVSEPRKFHMDGVYECSVIKRRLIGLTGEELRDPSQADSIVTLWGKIYRSSIIREHGLQIRDVRETGTAEDLLFNLDYLRHCKATVRVIDKPLYCYRKTNTGSFTQQYKPALFDKWQRLFSHIREHVQTPEEQTAFRNRIALSIIGLGINEMGNPAGARAQRKQLRAVLGNAAYRDALEQLDTRYLPLHWKLYFGAARKGRIFIFFYLTKTIAWLLNRKK